jgi:hypothetical protein
MYDQNPPSGAQRPIFTVMLPNRYRPLGSSRASSCVKSDGTTIVSGMSPVTPPWSSPRTSAPSIAATTRNSKSLS